MKHYSVLKEELINGLNINPDGIYVDATLGYAGDSSEILKRMKRGFLFAFDQDEEAIKYSDNILKNINSNYKIIYSNFKNIKEKLNEENISKVDGIIYDLGVSSPQIDEDYRGFSFMKDANLDMRMDLNNSLTAKYIVNNYKLEDLINIFYKYGEEDFSKSIAQSIVKNRSIKEINTTLELVDIIKQGVPYKYFVTKHPERRIFQAIRIEVNDELNVLSSSINDAIDMLKPGGRLCVITFHSLEDKICKDIFNEVTKNIDGYKDMPIIPKELEPKFKKIKTIEPSKEELDENNRSRSAKLRVIEKIGE